MTFAGFPSQTQNTAIPHVFFTDVLPRLGHDPMTLGVTLYAFQALQRQARVSALSRRRRPHRRARHARRT